jgi:cyclopropane-fatty-acyl-phospholipid synthase
MLYSVLKEVNFDGKIILFDCNNKKHEFGKGHRVIKVRLTNKLIEKKLFRNPSLYFGEGYMNEEIIIEEGTVEQLIDIVTSCYDDFVRSNFFFRIYENISSYLKELHQLNEAVNSKQNAAHHYDLKENLFRLFLDKDMQYSCGYFQNENISLDQAQIDKKKHIINKLQINEDMKILDIGCGWGGMAIEIAKQTGAKVKGITLSENQFATASKRVQEEGLSEKVIFQIQDYRNEIQQYDRIVSVGMFEHVGIKYFRSYLKKTYEILKDNGVFLLHTIGQRGVPTATSPWIRKYIFPGGYIPSLSDIVNETQKLNINIADIEVLRFHYAYTLSHWYKNIQNNKDDVIRMFDKRFYRMWEFYLLASKYSFLNMGNVVFQIQIAKNINNLPLTRNYMYN